MHNLIVPSLVILIAAAVIFGGQAIQESRLDDHIADAIAATLDKDAVEVTAMREVNKGYGICGQYRLPGGEPAAFFYNKVNEHLALGSDSRRYRNNCRTH
ncbi:MAG: hypothetical protein AWU55_212 [Halomonadaceae bacterium T82-2]|nr:MAG: hypothetical protein AWU55_212 [Halomonadaceae bacterium T82-2]